MLHHVRPTIVDVARRAKVSIASVSRTIHHQPGISQATKRRIQAVIEQLGYRPDPMLSALAKYRGKKRRKILSGPTLAYLIDFPERQFSHTHLDYFRGAEKCATELGFKLDLISTREMSSRRLTQVLQTRGIRGLLLNPPFGDSVQASIKVDWNHFATVMLSQVVDDLLLHRVCDDPHFSMNETLKRLYEKGYRRPAFVITRKHHERSHHSWMSAFLMYLHNHPTELREPFLISPINKTIIQGFRGSVFLSWWSRCDPKPDSLIFVDIWSFQTFTARMDERFFKETGLAVLCKMKSDNFIAGMEIDHKKHGEIATSLLASLIEREEFGMPAHAQTVLVRGMWTDGPTLS